jgi:transcriptional regulator with XRE-family HTH domain
MSRRVQRAFGARLKDVRRGRTLQKNLADQLGLSRTSISNIERGTHRIFLDQVYAAAHALGVELIELLPPVSDIYSAVKIHTASDDPLPDLATARAIEVARNVQENLAKRGSNERRLGPVSKHRRRNA